MSSLDALLASAGRGWAVYRALPTRKHPHERLIARTSRHFASGRPIPFVLEVSAVASAAGPTLRVAEAGVRQLPSFCPERHINRDGSFCMSLEPAPVPTAFEDGRRWWESLAGYLDLQLDAMLFGDWENGNAWAHGDAGKVQRLLEPHERWLPREVVAAGIAGRVPAPSARCPCGSGRPSERCHRKIIEVLAAGHDLMRRSEAEFWDPLRGVQCCGSMRRCALRCGTDLLERSRSAYRAIDGWHPSGEEAA